MVVTATGSLNISKRLSSAYNGKTKKNNAEHLQGEAPGAPRRGSLHLAALTVGLQMARPESSAEVPPNPGNYAPYDAGPGRHYVAAVTVRP